MNGLAPHTEKIIEAVSKLDGIKPYILVGGTALSIQISHRKSEDLDFMRWANRKDEKMEVDWVSIEKELKSIGNVQKTNLLGFDHVEYIVEGVKLSFYACNKISPVYKTIPYHNNIYLADLDSIAAMKMEVMLRRATFRDYYDLYCLMQGKTSLEIKEMINAGLKYSEHRLSTKNLLSLLTTSERYTIDEGFKNLDPKYQVNQQQIAEYMKSVLKLAYL